MPNSSRTCCCATQRSTPPLANIRERRNRRRADCSGRASTKRCGLVYAIQGYDAVHTALAAEDRSRIERDLLRPMADFLSAGQPSTFDRIHNHGTWAVAAVGMTGYVLDDEDYVRQALYGLAGDGETGFIKQLDELFSPDGYYTEGPYYQRYALMPFVLFAPVDRGERTRSRDIRVPRQHSAQGHHRLRGPLLRRTVLSLQRCDQGQGTGYRRIALRHRDRLCAHKGSHAVVGRQAASLVRC